MQDIGMLKVWTKGLFLIWASLCCMLANAVAEEGYKLPPKQIVDILDAAPEPTVRVLSGGEQMLLLYREGMPPISEMAKPMQRLAGMRLDANVNGRHGPRSIVGLGLKNIETLEERRVRLPENANIGSVSISADERKVAFTMTGPDGIGIWLLDIKSGEASELVSGGVNGTFKAFEWMSDSRTLLVAMIPEGRVDMPVRPLTPKGPVVQNATGEKSTIRTYQDLLKDEFDETMFDWLITSQLTLIDTKTGDRKFIGKPDTYIGFNASPDRNYVMVTRLKHPYSYHISLGSFPQTAEIWTIDGDFVRTVFDRPLEDKVKLWGVVPGPRVPSWQPTHPARLFWIEALDGGDPDVEADYREQLAAIDAPFKGEPRKLFKIKNRTWGFGTSWLSWIQGSEKAIILNHDEKTRIMTETLIDLANIEAGTSIFTQRNRQDRYADPGDFMMTRNQYGRSVVLVHDGAVFRAGTGATPEGDRPFLNKVDLETLQTTELWRNSGENYEQVVDLVADDASSFITRYEDLTTPPNYKLHNASGEVKPLTEFPDPHPSLSGIKKELITYKREDGVQLSSTLYLPADYKKGDRLPVIIWAYPREFSDARTAGQVTGSKYRFTRIRSYSHLFFLTEGYAVMDRATMPVVGSDPKTVNDTFIEQIVASAKAAIDVADERGFGDRNRVGVGGHSYGAFMTANLLAHSDLFRAGIARSGAYNRTLTPFGFQAELRTFWQASDIYFKLSPFMHADQVNEPLLMIHGQMDNNPGTYPMQSERMYHAVKGNGGIARLVMLPNESHSYLARESIMHTLAEMIDWMNMHVRDAKTETTSK